jgi:hypothetical protein
MSEACLGWSVEESGTCLVGLVGWFGSKTNEWIGVWVGVGVD